MKLWKLVGEKFIILLCILLFMLSNVYSQNVNDIDNCLPVHDVGNIEVKTVFTYGFGGGFRGVVRCSDGTYPIPGGSEYPKDSNVPYLDEVYFSVGGIKNGDTLVSQGEYAEFRQYNDYVYRSILDPLYNESNLAISQQDYISHAADTFTNVYYPFPFSIYDFRPHKPLGIELENNSYAWSYEYAEDFVLFNIILKNISEEYISDLYFNIRLVANINIPSKDDEVGGFLKDYTFSDMCDFQNKLNLFWVADNDGDPVNGQFVDYYQMLDGDLIKSAPDVTGILFLNNQKSTEQKISYNWWIANYILDVDYGPMMRKNQRTFYTGGTGLPFGDGARYYVISNGEIDFDQIYTSRHTNFDPDWLPPPEAKKDNIADGLGSTEIEHHLSIGPYDLPPGAEVSIPFAYVAGEDFHTNPNNIDFLPDFPESYYKNLDFSDIAKNALWARWIYDNPGVDTDGDGDSGRAVECNGERIWVEGDGIPDWKAAGPPPAPYFWLTQEENAIHVRFNGSRSETEKDIFTKIADFEGYNIYFGRDDREASLSLVASYDLVNYDKYIWHPELDEGGKYIVEDIPYSLDSLKCLYGNNCDDSLFDPTRFTAVTPLVTSDSIFYFTKHHNNASFSAISKVYPNARDPRLIPEDSLTDEDFTEEGFYKYFEYEFTIDNLLPTVEYWVNITAFDFGSPKSGLQALETSKTVGLQMAYPLSHEEVVDTNNEIFVYPNPYRIDANYRGNSFEGIGEEDRHVDRVRKINFANLPPKCEIKIFSLDGDLIRHLSHDIPESDPTYTHHTWDLITRNTQLVVSGMYYWTVEFPNGETKIGKFVVVM